MRDFENHAERPNEALTGLRERLAEDDFGLVKTFVSDFWTLEYELSRCGLAKQVYIAACLAKNDDHLNDNKKSYEDAISEAEAGFAELESEAGENAAILGTQIYRLFHSGVASKAVAAQYFADLLPKYCRENGIDAAGLRARLPEYLVNAIDYVTQEDPGEDAKPRQ